MAGQKEYKKPTLEVHGSVASLTLGKPGSDLGNPTGMGGGSMGGGSMGMG